MTFLVGVLAIQGAFSEHVSALHRLSQADADKYGGLKVIEIRSSHDVSDELCGIIIPGGESTTLSIFLGADSGCFLDALRRWSKLTGKVLMGTCTGLIMLSDRVEMQKDGGQLQLGGLPITTRRNYFGRQKQSFEQTLEIVDRQLQQSSSSTSEKSFPGVFIRAPGIVSIDSREDLTVLATLRDSDDRSVPVAVRKGTFIGLSFHPELTTNLAFHRYFLDLVLEQQD